jgi:hypothetical protein
MNIDKNKENVIKIEVDLSHFVLACGFVCVIMNSSELIAIPVFMYALIMRERSLNAMFQLL